MSYARKRKHSSQSNGTDHLEPIPKLFIQAHEVDLTHGSEAARALEMSPETGIAGQGLVKWTSGERADDRKVIWVDRYDARLLLDTLPAIDHTPQLSSPDSTSGWTDLPSDTEDTFFFDSEEAEDYRRDKRRRLITQTHQDRLKAFEETEERSGDVWGGSDEEPDETEKQLMRRTASHILSSPNPAQLEMRILANHGADKHFAFLRGRWSKFWELTKSQLKIKQNQEKEPVGLGGLAGYGSDDSNSKDDLHETPKTTKSEEEAIKEARRTRLKEWTDKRRTAKRDS